MNGCLPGNTDWSPLRDGRDRMAVALGQITSTAEGE